MKKPIILAIAFISLLSLPAGRCEDLCGLEVTGHNAYIAIAPFFRTAEQRATEQRRYEAVMALCASGASPAQIQKAQALSSAARQ